MKIENIRMFTGRPSPLIEVLNSLKEELIITKLCKRTKEYLVTNTQSQLFLCYFPCNLDAGGLSRVRRT